ncbi:acyltransferase [Hymenobacter sp. GOD-10R]|uniref:acyltransferase family protein n=1 Tax=Hymenobacter sp. GOD-10R TaxID=3093922 RepID=UPI002D7872CC|nr:acyltransferase [Hymenobacter sp. GOD-10R]WRQ27174.1 acyltransferase [Hymenobacter sp. GOD-10R]
MSLLSPPPSPTPSTTRAKTYLPALTGVRALAAYLVFLHHFNPFQSEGAPQLLQRIVLEFHIGVSIFFVLSGFLITLRYYGSEQWTWSWWGPYLRNRFARIYPMYFLLTCAFFLLRFQTEGVFVFRTWLFNVLFLRGFFDEMKFSGIAQGWTLTVEECFYLFAPVAFMLLRKRIKLWVQPFLLLAVGCLLVLTVGQLHHHGLFGNFKFVLLYTFFGRCFEFYAGMQLAFWYRQDRIRRYSFPGLLTSLGLVVMAAALGGMVWTKGGYSYGQEHPFGAALNNVVLPGGIVTFFAGLLTEPTWLRRFFASSPLQLLGKSSYVFYLIHMGFIQKWLATNWTENSGKLFVILNILAIVLYYAVEQPLNRLLRRT